MRKPTRMPIVITALLALVLAACGGEDGSATTAGEETTTTAGATTTSAGGDTTTTVETTPTTEPLTGSIVLAGFGSVFQEVMEASIIPAFTAATGVEVIYETGTAGGNFAKVQAGASAPTIDVYWGNSLTHEQGLRQGLFEVLPIDAMPNADGLFDYAYFENDTGIIMGTYATGLEIRTDKLEEAGIPEPTSWAALWDPAFAGHVALYDIAIGFTQDALPFWAEALGADPASPDAVFEKLAEIRGDLVAVATAPPEINQLLQSGEVWITYNSNNRVFDLAREGVPVKWIAPDEGAPAFNNTFDLVKNAPNPDAAVAFIDFVLSAESQQAIAEGIGLTPVRPGLDLPAEIVEATGYSATDGSTFNVVPPRTSLIVDNLETWIEEWAAVFSS